jgi:hypothetical protein
MLTITHPMRFRPSMMYYQSSPIFDWRYLIYIFNLSFFMTRQFKQWWSVIPTISVKRKITSHLKSMNTQKSRNMALDIQVRAWDKHRNASLVSRLIGLQSLSRSMDLQRHYGKKSITDSLRHLWFVFRIASVMYVFPRYNNKKYRFASNSKGRTILTREYSNIQVSQLSGTVLTGEMCTSRYPRNDLLRIMLLRYSRNILFYSNKLHVIKIIPFITTYFSSNLIANFFDCTYKSKKQFTLCNYAFLE